MIETIELLVYICCSQVKTHFFNLNGIAYIFRFTIRTKKCVYCLSKSLLLKECFGESQNELDKFEFVGVKMKKYIANIITSCRIFCSILMMFFPVFSSEFFIVYLLCGISDMVDGTVARKTNAANEFGARFDTVADFIFVAVSLIKLLPIIHIPRWLWTWIVVIAIIKISNIISGFIYKKKLISLHTIMNKTTGLLLFLLPLTIHFIELKYSSVVVCSIATFSAIQECHIIRTGHKIV